MKQSVRKLLIVIHSWLRFRVSCASVVMLSDPSARFRSSPELDVYHPDFNIYLKYNLIFLSDSFGEEQSKWSWPLRWTFSNMAPPSPWPFGRPPRVWPFLCGLGKVPDLRSFHRSGSQYWSGPDWMCISRCRWFLGPCSPLFPRGLSRPRPREFPGPNRGQICARGHNRRGECSRACSPYNRIIHLSLESVSRLYG